MFNRGRRSLYCKSCFAKTWARFTDEVIDGRVWRSCTDCGFRLCLGYAHDREAHATRV